MTEFVSGFRYQTEDELRPRATPLATGNISLHLVAFDNLQIGNDADIYTLQGGELIHANRNAVVNPEQDASNIARIHANLTVPYKEAVKTPEDKVRHIARIQANLIVSMHRSLHIPARADISAHGYSVRPAAGSKIPPVIDLRSIDDLDTPHEQKLLELHKYSRLVKHLEEKPERELDLYFLRSFGAYVLKNIA
jgi:hypothetical protein